MGSILSKPLVQIMNFRSASPSIFRFAAVMALACSASTAAAGDDPPLAVFILAGQSNMQGHAHVRTFDAMALDPKTAPLLEEMRDAEGAPRVCEDVWISSVGLADDEKVGQLTAGFGAQAGGPKIGPEFTFGLEMQKRIDGPILIIKTAWGGKSLHTDFRPPGAAPFAFREDQLEKFAEQGKDIAQIKAEKAAASGHYYRLMVEHVQRVLADIRRVYPGYDAGQGFRLAGFVWFQGWNDMVDQGTYPQRGEPGGYDGYSELMAQFIRDVRQDLGAPELPFVIGVMGAGGPTGQYGADQQRYKAIHQSFRDAMAAPAALPEFRETVAAVLTENHWDMGRVALQEKEKSIKPQIEAIQAAIEEGAQSREDGQAAIDALYAKTFTPDELITLKDSVSNAEFHYLGSAKIMAPIGKGFAEALAELNDGQ
ncbi:sialate O-acetylesterase [soil metagenome]